MKVLDKVASSSDSENDNNNDLLNLVSLFYRINLIFFRRIIF